MPILMLKDLSGGINEGASPNNIGDNEAQQLINFLPFAGRLLRRLGTSYVNSNGFTQALLGIFRFVTSTGTDVIIGAGSTLLRWCTPGAGAWTDLTNNDATAVNAGTAPWCFEAYKDILYALRENTVMRRIVTAGTSFDVAGITAPTVAATIADGAAGVIPVGAVVVVFTFYNTATGAESNPSPVSASLAHGANLQINWTAVQVSVDPQVNARRLYRTTPGSGATAPRLFIGQINNNTATVFTDNIPIASMGAPCATIENGPVNVAIPNATVMALHKERLFVTDGKQVNFSEIGLPESFDPTNALNAGPNDGHLIRALHSFQDRLIIGKTNKTYALSGVDETDFAVNVFSEDYGCYSHHSMQSVGGSLFWFTGDTIVRSNGINVVSIADVKLQKRLAVILANMTATLSRNIVATVDAAKNLYIISFPIASYPITAPVMYECFAYNYITNAWAPLHYGAESGASGYIRCFSPVVASSLTKGNYMAVGADGLIYLMFDSANPTVDLVNLGSSSQVCSFITKSFSPATPGTIAFVRRVHIRLSTPQTGYPNTTLDITVYRDNGEVVATRTGVSFVQTGAQKRRWFAINVSAVQGSSGLGFSAGESFSIGFANNVNVGYAPDGIDAIAIEYKELKRRVKII